MANIFHIDRQNNTITLGKSDTQITVGNLSGILLGTSGVVSVITNNSTNWNTAYAHSNLTSGNPHSVTQAEVGLSSVENTALSTWVGSANITTLGTVATGIWEATDIGISHGGTGQSTAQAAINALSAVGAATNEHVLTKDTGTGNAIWKVSAGATGEKVKVDVGATADYIGAASNDGVLRTTTGLSYVDGGNFVTLGLSHLGFESLTSPTPNDRIPFWDESASAFAWLSPSTGLAISATSLGLNFGALGEETTPDVLDVVCIYDPTGGAHHKVTLDNLKAFGAYTNEDDSSAVLLKDHAYLANQDGIVTVDAESGGAGHYIRGYIGATNDPAGAGDRITAYQDFGGAGYDMGISFPVAKGKYFEITASATITNIWWQPIGVLIKPTDQD